MAKKNYPVPPLEAVAAATIDTRSTPLDEWEGKPRRIERRSVFGHLIGEYRVSVMQPATMDDVMAGRAEAPPGDPEGTPVTWKPLCQWQTLSEAVDPGEALSGLLDPNRMIN